MKISFFEGGGVEILTPLVLKGLKNFQYQNFAILTCFKYKGLKLFKIFISSEKRLKK